MEPDSGVLKEVLFFSILTCPVRTWKIIEVITFGDRPGPRLKTTKPKGDTQKGQKVGFGQVAVAQKTGIPNGTLVSGKMDQNLRNLSLSLSSIVEQVSLVPERNPPV